MDLTLDRPLLLRGKIVQPDGTGLDRYVLVENGVIKSVSRGRPPLTRDAVLIELGHNDWIYPGLIDLHTHTDYNMLPIWETDKSPFANRFAWRGDDGYRRVVSGGHDLIVKQQRAAVAVFAELQAIAGGTATIQESQPLESNQSGDGNPLLCRGTGLSVDLGLGSKQILSVVDFFRPNASGDTAEPQQKKLDQYLNMRAEGSLQATLAHLAEGRSGFGNDKGVDPYSRLEFETLMRHPAFQDAAAVRSSPLALIHCSGIDVDNPDHINFLRERNISVIWSPVSNLLLYGDTLDVETLVAQGVNVALGSDWSPSGSKHLWEEAKFVRFYFEAIGSLVSDEQVFQMVTTNAARCLGLKTVGRIEPDCFADFFILRSPLESDNALEVFFKTSDRDVRAVIIGGRPVYGAREFLNKFQLELQPLPRIEGAAVRNKVVHLPAHLEVNVERDFGALESLLKTSPLKLKRNNLLVSADTPYRERINLLRQGVVSYGWQVQRWRRKKQKSLTGKSVGAPAPPGIT
ncbi:MAG TPA: amidohydrolase family protein [Pyrinomonadaceae bacterium]|nr:amidohydrolase family protein [Pyrinomonadaceae bacterium]